MCHGIGIVRLLSGLVWNSGSILVRAKNSLISLPKSALAKIRLLLQRSGPFEKRKKCCKKTSRDKFDLIIAGIQDEVLNFGSILLHKV